MRTPTAEDYAAAARVIGEPHLTADYWAYCVMCKAKVKIVQPTKIKMRNGKPAVTGHCETCDGLVFKLGHPFPVIL